VKTAIFSAFALFFGLYAVALVTLQSESPEDTVVLRWATDPNPARDRQVAAFTNANPGISVTTESGDPTKLLVQCATGVGPDLLDLKEPLFETMVRAGLLLDLTEPAKQYGFAPDKTFPAIGPTLSVDGRQFRFPCNVNAQAVIFNKAVFDDYQLPYPQQDWTWDDFAELGRAIRETPSKSGRKHIPLVNWNSSFLFADLLMAHGGRYFSEDGLVCLLDSPEAIAAFQHYHDLMFKHRVMPTPEQSAAMSGQGGWNSGGINWFASGEAAMIMIGRWFSVQALRFPQLQGQLAAVPLPRFPDHPSRGFIEARGLGVNAKTKHPEAALKFLSYLAGPDYGALIIKDGDSLPPGAAMARDGAALTNEHFPDADFHQTFIDAASNAQPIDTSPFIDSAQVQRWIAEFLERLENRVASPSELAVQLTTEINRAIARNIERDSRLRQRAEALRRENKAKEAGL